MSMDPFRRIARWRNRDSEIEEELQAHLALAIRDRLERGEPRAEAERNARREFGNRTLIAEVTRETWGWSLLDRLGRDFAIGVRGMRRRPGFVAAAVLMVALGIGANTAVFSVVNALLVKPLPYPDPDRIVDLSTVLKDTGESMLVSEPDFRDWHDQSTAFASMAFYSSFEAAVKAGAEAEYARAAAVTAEFFEVFAPRPAAGRLFGAEEYQTVSNAAVIGESYWRNRFGGDARVLGRTIRLSDRTLTIVGVLPGGFRFPGRTDIWIPLHLTRRMGRGAHNFEAVGRLKPGFSLEQAQAQMTAIAGRLSQQYPSSNRNCTVRITRLRDRLAGHLRPSLYVLCGAVGMVLLIACVNLAGLLLVRAAARGREMAVRIALGASRVHVALQLMMESLVLALPVAAVGLLLAHWGTKALLALAPAEVARLGEPGLDARVLAFALGLSVLTSLLFGAVPALHVRRVDLNEVLKQATSRSVGPGRAGRLRAGLVTGQIALSVMLLAGAGLLTKSFVRLQNTELGFRPESLLVMRISYPASNPESARQATRFVSRLVAAVAALPGVTAAGAAHNLPGSESWSWGGHWADRRPPAGAARADAPKTLYSEVAPGTFRALGIPLTRGREFADSDTHEAPSVAIINESLARHAFPDHDPLGRVIVCGLDERANRGMRIVGVVADVREYGPAREPLPAIYMPHTQHPGFSAGMQVVARSSADPSGIIQAMREKARELSPEVPIEFTTMEELLAENVAAPRFRTLLLSVFAVLALCLAVMGLYGVTAHLAAQRSGEIGLRMALGAGPVAVFRMLLREGLRLAAAGLALGLAGAAAAGRFLGSMLFDVKPNDPAVYAGLSVLVGIVTMAAISVPAWRATRVDPVVTLRRE